MSFILLSFDSAFPNQEIKVSKGTGASLDTCLNSRQFSGVSLRGSAEQY